MGETAAKLRLVFDAIASTCGVYLFDEFDALGSQRGAGQDAGEIRRVLNSFLQFLEQDTSDSIIVGATNHLDLLDVALFRRFDASFDYALPSAEVAIGVMRARLASMNTAAVAWEQVASAAGALRNRTRRPTSEGADADHQPQKTGASSMGLPCEKRSCLPKNRSSKSAPALSRWSSWVGMSRGDEAIREPPRRGIEVRPVGAGRVPARCPIWTGGLDNNRVTR